MSAISGICRWGGRPIDDAPLRVMASHCERAGSDSSRTAMPIEGIALQAHLWHFDRLSERERQPFAFANGSVLTWDGRLDNRDDLLVLLHHDLTDDVTDAALVAAAYVRWGIDCVQHLIGDWSFAIWDTAERRLLLARDYVGNRPLYYIDLGDGVAWASNLDALAAAFDRYSQPNDAYIAGKLTYGVPPGVTPFTGIHALRAGHLLTASKAAGLTVRRYWIYAPTRIRYRDVQEYAEQMRSLLIDAVRVRLRANRRVWAHLSGGWDSSSIVCIADGLIRRGQVDAPSLQPVSGMVSASPESDEAPFISAVERWCGLTTVRHESESDLPVLDELLGQRRPYPHRPARSLEAEVHRAGDRIVLSGELGDAVMIRGSRSIVSLLEPLHEGRPLEFIRLCLARAAHRQRPVTVLLKQLVLMGYLPRLEARQRARRQQQQARQSQMTYQDDATRFGVTHECYALASPTVTLPTPSVEGFPLVKRGMVANLYSAADMGALSNSDLAPDILRTYPYSHRPLVTFMLGVPQLAFWDPIVSRSGMRRAMQGILAPEILARSSKCDVAPALNRWMRDWRQSFDPASLGAIGQWELVRRSFVLPSAVESSIAELTHGRGPSDFLIAALYLEAWLRSLDVDKFSVRHLLREPGQATMTVAHAGRTGA
jgi:asparagine synthase (glutamine-hydrolysing)